MRSVPRRLLATAVVAACLFGGYSFFQASVLSQSKHCIEADLDLQLCALSDMAKPSLEQHSASEHDNYAISASPLKLHAARNETVAFQWQLTGANRAGLTVEVSAFYARTKSDDKPLPVISQFLAHFHSVDRGGYSWGPETDVLPWPAHYPDALIPQVHACSGQTLYRGITEGSAKQAQTLLWQDIYIPKSLAPGLYTAQATLKRAGDVLTQVPIELNVWPVTLPDENSIDAIGELYRTYRMEGVGEISDTQDWRAMSNCYQQMAHAHRSTFLERNPVMPSNEQQWQDYASHYGDMLDGELFSVGRGYQGPGKDTPVSVWRTPWPQPYDMKLDDALSYADIRQYENKAQQWVKLARQNNWDNSRWFAYVFDEVDGPEHSDKSYLAMAHQQMALVQDAIDAGSGDKSIDLLWTSHSNPADWRDDPSIDLRGKVRLWAPNAHAAEPDFLAEQSSKGDRTWFYHSGHPAVGAHVINASGIELRTWGVIAARYNIDGVLMWAVNLGNDDKPFADPSYKPDDDRFGNGVLVYPGRQLPKIGFPAARGAIPSMRLKSWRRGLQDYELVQLAAEQHPAATAQLLQQMIPQALAQGTGKAAWSSDPADWIAFKLKLLELASLSPTSVPTKDTAALH